MPVPAAFLDEGIVTDGEVSLFSFVSYHAGAFNHGENLIRVMNVRQRAGAIVKEDGGQSDLITVLITHQNLLVDYPLKALGVIHEAGFRLVHSDELEHESDSSSVNSFVRAPAHTSKRQGDVDVDDRKRASSGSPFEATVGFSRGIRVGDRILISGTAPVWPDGSCAPDVEGQARRCFEIILKAIEELGGQAKDVVRTRMFLTDLSYADGVSRVHGEIFGTVRPAATMVVIAGLLDTRWKVEIEAEAILT